MPQLTPKSILVLCEGNFCRSPLAEALLQAELGPGIRVESAGLGALEGYPPHPAAVSLMAGRDIDITSRRSRQVTPAMALAADLILVMDQHQKQWCEAMAPSTLGRVHLLGCWLPPDQQEIPDPNGKSGEAFASAFSLIARSVTLWRHRLSPSGQGPRAGLQSMQGEEDATFKLKALDMQK